MKYFSVFLVIGFVSLAVFGVLAVNHTQEHGHSGCIATAIQKSECPRQNSSLNYLAFHFDAFKDFSTAAFGKNIFFLLLTLILFAIGAGLALFFGKIALPQLGSVSSRSRNWEFFSSPQTQELTHWLALHENSPARL